MLISEYFLTFCTPYHTSCSSYQTSNIKHQTGYSRYFKGLKEFLSSQPTVANKIEVVAREDPNVTGNFEVSVVKTGQVLHSKRHAGQGKAQTEGERMAILEQIQEILGEE